MRPLETCPLCATADLVPFAMSPVAKGALHFAQVRCRGCGLLAAQPQATPDEMAVYYREQYYETEWPDPERIWHENSRAYARYELPLMQRLLGGPLPRGGRAVEIGCGYGVLLRLLQDRGHSVSGLDPSISAVNHCRSAGLDVQLGSVPGAPFDAASFELALTFHVIEHVADPRAFVRELVGLVQPGGVVVVVTEDAWISEYGWERVRARLAGRLPPFRSSRDHTFVFEARHLRRLLLEEGCATVSTCSYEHIGRESPHWRLYRAPFRLVNRLTGHGPLLMAVGRRAE